MPLIPIPVSTHRAIPWKNGLGTSHTIIDFPTAAGFDAVQWQVGWTTIGGDCPFSNLPGLDRTFTVIEGAGVGLASVDEAGKPVLKKVEPLAPYAFRGDWTTHCRLIAGPVKVFNVMTRRGAFSADVTISRGRALENTAGTTLVVVDLETLVAWVLAGEPGSIPSPRGACAAVRIRGVPGRTG